MADPGFPIEGRRLPTRPYFGQFVCQNKRIGTFWVPWVLRSANDHTYIILYINTVFFLHFITELDAHLLPTLKQSQRRMRVHLILCSTQIQWYIRVIQDSGGSSSVYTVRRIKSQWLQTVLCYPTINTILIFTFFTRQFGQVTEKSTIFGSANV